MDLARFLRRPRSLRGGLSLPDAGYDLIALPERTIPCPPVLRVPLAQGVEPPAAPLVRIGDAVQPGQMIARGDRGAVHAPAPGKVADFLTAPTPYAEATAAVELETEMALFPPAPSTAEAGKATVDWSLERMQEMGVDADSLIALAASPSGCSGATLLINGLDTQPFRFANTCAIREHAESLIDAARSLHEIYGLRRTHLIVDREHRRHVQSLCRRARGTPVRITPLLNRYPQDTGPLLVKAVTKTEIRGDQSVAQLGIAIIEAACLIDIRKAAEEALPATHISLAVAGSAVIRPARYRVPLGTSIDYLANVTNLRAGRAIAIADSMLTGPIVPEPHAVITRQTKVVFFERHLADRHLPVACIRCGWCQEVCPAGLDPRALLDVAERRAVEEAGSLHPRACFDCGLCNYICPSCLPLMRGVHLCREYVT